MKTLSRPCLFVLFFIVCALTVLLLVTSGNDAGARAELDFSVELTTPENVMMNEPFPTNLTIHHHGEAASDVSVVIYSNHPERNGTLLYSSTEDFDAGTNELARYPELAIEDVTGYRDVYAIIDFGDEFPEDDEENNLVFNAVEVRENYDDILLIINNNSALSKEIGQYFAEKRKIKHILYVDASTAETISRPVFNDTILQPLKDHLITNSLEDKINYFVTTKDVPLRISEQDTSDDNINNPNTYDRACVDSEINLLNGPLEDRIGEGGRLSNPYNQEDEHFFSKDYGIYLTTRLTGYNLSEIKAIIDNALNASGEELGQGLFVLDVDPDRDGGSYEIGNDWLRDANVSLKSRNFNTFLDENDTYVTYQENVTGYASWCSNDHHDTDHAKPHNQWLPGALAETYVSTSGRSFDYPPSYGQSLIADIIYEGVTGVKGYVYEPYLDAIAHPDILFPRYVDGLNLAESYYAASQYMGWMDVVVGDPKLAPFRSYDLDLAVTALDLSETKVVVEKQFTITTIIRNLGKLPADNITHTLFEGEPGEERIIKSFFIPRLAPSEELGFTIPWQINETGQYYIYSSLDHQNTIKESRENNNELDKRIRIVEPPELRGWFTAPAEYGAVVRSGRDVYVNFTVENGGGIEARDFDVVLGLVKKDGGRAKTEIVLLDERIPSLEVEEQERFSVVWLANLTGNMSLVLELDPAAAVEESDEENNTLRCPIWVNLPPVLLIQLEREIGIIEEDLSFSASGSFDPDGAIVSYDWSITGKENFQRSGEDVTVLFSKAGNYTITLTVQDNSSVTSSEERSYFVNALPRPYFTISYLNNTKDFYIYNELVFNASFSKDFESSIEEYAWDLADGNVSGGVVTSHVYTKSGNYSVTLTITDKHNASALLTKQIEVNDRNPELEDIVIENGLSFSSFDTIIFNASLSEENPFPVVSHVWDLGDGGLAEGEEPGSVEHNYTKPGDYLVTLTVYEEYGSRATVTRAIHILNRPPEIDTLTIPEEKLFAGVPFALQFSAHDPEDELVSIIVNLTEGPTDTLVQTLELPGDASNATLLLEEAGSYSLTLTAKDSFAENNETSYSYGFVVLESRPTAVLSLQKKSSGVRDKKELVNCSFTAAASHFKEGSITGYRFDFGDGSQSPWSDEPTATHEYHEEGAFTVTLFVRNNLGFEDTTTLSVEVVFQGIADEEGDGGEGAGFLDGFSVSLLVLVFALGCLAWKRR